MRPKGTIYHHKKSDKHGEMVLFLPFLVRLIFHSLRTAGAGMIAFAVLAFSFSFGPVIQKEFQFRFRQDVETKPEPQVVSEYSIQKAEAQKILEVQKEAQSYGVTSYFSVVIPKIDAKANVIANVDPADKADYLDALSKGVAHAKGTYFPGQSGTVFLFSHSTDSPLNFARYNAVFYLLNKLEAGDRIIVFFADKKYVYEVEKTVTADPKDVSWLEPDSQSDQLILMTCDPPGTTWRRLLIIAKPIN